MKYRFEIKIYFYMKPLTLSDLRTRQAWPLNQKIDHTCYAMETFVAYCKEHDRTPYVSFSGGLNSTVLLDLARRFVDPNMKGVFCSTGNEYPEIVRFVRHTDNIEIIHPAMPPREVMARYGFPLVSKEQAQAVRNIRTTNSDKLRTYRLYGDGVRRAGVLSEKWRYLISEPYMTSEKCCEILKSGLSANSTPKHRALGWSARWPTKANCGKPCMSVAAGATSFRIIPARFTAPRCRSGLPRTAGTTFTDSTYPIARFTTYRALPEPAAYSAGSAHTSEGGGGAFTYCTLYIRNSTKWQ